MRAEEKYKKDASGQGGLGGRSLDLDIQQRDAVEAELARRALAHKRRVARLKRGTGLRAQAKKAPARRPLDFLAIGNSWFDYPLNGNEPSFVNTAIVAQLTQLGSPPPLVLNYALYGQATTSVLTYENQQKIIECGDRSDRWLNGGPTAFWCRWGETIWSATNSRSISITTAQVWTDALPGALGSVRASYLDLFALRDAVLPGKPVIGHCYDYAIPNGVPALCAGPWLQPSLEFSGYDLAEGLAIVSSMIDGFYAMVSALAGDAGNNFVLVDTRGTLKRVSGASDGWANELHPYPAGFSLLAQRFSPALQGLPAASVSAPAPRRRSSK